MFLYQVNLKIRQLKKVNILNICIFLKLKVVVEFSRILLHKMRQIWLFLISMQAKKLHMLLVPKDLRWSGESGDRPCNRRWVKKMRCCPLHFVFAGLRHFATFLETSIILIYLQQFSVLLKVLDKKSFLITKY